MSSTEMPTLNLVSDEDGKPDPKLLAEYMAKTMELNLSMLPPSYDAIDWITSFCQHFGQAVQGLYGRSGGRRAREMVVDFIHPRVPDKHHRNEATERLLIYYYHALSTLIRHPGALSREVAANSAWQLGWMYPAKRVDDEAFTIEYIIEEIIRMEQEREKL